MLHSSHLLECTIFYGILILCSEKHVEQNVTVVCKDLLKAHNLGTFHLQYLTDFIHREVIIIQRVSCMSVLCEIRFRRNLLRSKSIPKKIISRTYYARFIVHSTYIFMRRQARIWSCVTHKRSIQHT